ncbi:MAG: hypothetical protein U0X75_25950 [Acidobacteriota bacterium]
MTKKARQITGKKDGETEGKKDGEEERERAVQRRAPERQRRLADCIKQRRIVAGGHGRARKKTLQNEREDKEAPRYQVIEWNGDDIYLTRRARNGNAAWSNATAPANK